MCNDEEIRSMCAIVLRYTVWSNFSVYFAITGIVPLPLSAILQLQEELGYTVAVVCSCSVRDRCHTKLGKYRFFFLRKVTLSNKNLRI